MSASPTNARLASSPSEGARRQEAGLRGPRVVRAVCVAAGVLALTAGTAGPALAGATVVRPSDCGFQPGPGEVESIPGTGVTTFIPATACQIVLTPTGGAYYVIHAELPDGVSLDRALVGPGTVVTPSGRINSHGSFGG